jgi:hypothetical protein
MRSLFADPVEILNAISKSRHDAPAQKRVRDAAASLSERWDRLPAESLHDLLRSIIVRAQVYADRIDLDVDSAKLASRLLNDGKGDTSQKLHAVEDGEEEHLITLSIPARLKRTGMEMKFIIQGAANATPADTSLIRLLVRAKKIGKRLFETGSPTLEDIARDEKMSPSYATRLARLTFLAPDIVAAILAGRQPADLTANKLMVDTRLPLDWRDQRAALGFA